MKRILQIMLIGVVVWGCEKEIQPPLGEGIDLSGKLKSINKNDGRWNYYFTYDSEGRLSQVSEVKSSHPEDTSIIFEVDYVNANKIIVNDSYWEDKVWIVNLSGKQITSLKLQDPAGKFEFIFNGEIIESVHHPDLDRLTDLMAVTNYSNYEIQYDGNNYGRYLTAYTYYVWPYPSEDRSGYVNNFTFTNHSNDNKLPFQEGLFDNYLGDLNVMYILRMEGYYPFAANKNLIDTRNGLAYEYSFNDLNQVISMVVPYTSDSLEVDSEGPIVYTYTITYH